MNLTRLFSYALNSIRFQLPLHSIKGGFSLIGSHRFYSNASHDTVTSPEYSDSSSGESDDEGNGSKAHKIKKQILTAALKHVSKQGWGHRAIAAGAESIGYPGASHGMFSRGGIELVNHFYIESNEKLAQELSSIPTPKDIRIRGHEDFLQNALEMRLRMILPYIGTWTQALGLMALPVNIPDTTKNLQKLVDDIWYYMGDRSSDFSWYTKRVGLAAVYVSTQLVLIQDKSENYTDTWAFLNRRIKQLEMANQQFTEKQAFAEGIPGFVESTVITLKNVLGLRNMQRRHRS